MTYIRPKFRHPELPKNKLGYTIDYYEGALSTLCAGCGHDSISAAIVQASFEMNIEPHRLAKHHVMDCGNPECYLCGNPRKTHKDKLTQQEKRLFQNLEQDRDRHSNGLKSDE